MLKTPPFPAAAVQQSPRPHWYAQLALALLGIGYPVARIVLPGAVQPAIFIPLLLLLAWYVWQLGRARNLLRSPLGIPLLLCAGLFLLSSLFGIAPPPTIAAIVFDWIEGVVILFLVVHLLASGWRPQVFVFAALLASSLFLLVHLAGILGWWAQWMQLWQPGMALIPSGTRLEFGGTHPNQAALLINLGVPLAIAALWQAPAFWQRGLWALWLLGATVALFFTSSRGGWLAMVAASATIVVPLLWSALRARRWRRVAATLVLGGGYAALFLTLFVANLQEVQAQRGRVPAAQQQAAPATPTQAPTPTPMAAATPTATPFPTATPAPSTSAEQTDETALEEAARVLANSAGRTTFFSRALEFFAERPLLGLGPEGYATRYAQVEPHSRLFPAQHAHSIYFQVLSEWGALGGGALLLLVGTTLRLWWRGWHTAAPLLPEAAPAPTPPLDGRLLLLACGAAATGFAVHGLVEVPVVSITIIYISLLAVAITSGGAWLLRDYPAAAGETAAPSSPTGSLWRGIRHVHPLHTLIVVVAILAWGSGSAIVLARSANDARLDAARTALQQGNAAQAVDRYTRSIEAYPWMPAAYYERATALAWLAREQPALLPNALAAQETAVAHAPAHGIVAPVNEAALLLAMAEAERAAERLRTPIEMAPRWAVPRMLLAQIGEQAGDTEAARTHWRWVLNREPELAASAACLRSEICPTMSLPQKEYAALEEARMLLEQPDAAALREIERLASAWRSVDIWSVGVMAAERANDPQTRARFLAAARAESENVTKEVTPLLATVLLRDALARNDREAVRELTQTWLAASDLRFVPQLTRHLVTPTDLELAQALIEAARFLDDAALLEQAQHRLAFVEDALPAQVAQ
jgi:O-antigen ligase/tetratricopeptide (TPR) repeat protein